MFIGAQSFLALNLIIPPVIAIMLSPSDAFLTSLFGGLLSFYAAPSQAMFGQYTILLPVCGATFGSLTYHKEKIGALATLLSLMRSISSYSIINYQFPYFVAAHSLACLLSVILLFRRMTPVQVEIPILAFVATMSEQGMMIRAVHLLCLPWQAFVGILPLMLYERIVGTVGGTLVIFAPLKGLQRYFDQI